MVSSILKSKILVTPFTTIQIVSEQLPTNKATSIFNPFSSVMAKFRSNGRNTATGFSCRIFAHKRRSGEIPSTTTSTTTTTTTTTPEVIKDDFGWFSGQNSAPNVINNLVHVPLQF